MPSVSLIKAAHKYKKEVATMQINDMLTQLKENPAGNMLIDRFKVHEPSLETYVVYEILSRKEIINVQTTRKTVTEPELTGKPDGFYHYKVMAGLEERLKTITVEGGRVFNPTL
jgi:hypothetical protein